MDIRQLKENKLKTILQFSIPSIIAMLLQTVITITDGYFTENYVGDNALAAINLGLPILYVYLGAGLCVGVGGSVISGRLLGAKNRQKASEVFSQTMVTAVVIGVILSLAVFVLFTPILGFLRADGELSGYFTDYYRIMLFTYPLMVLGTILGMFIRVNGKPQLCMLVSIAEGNYHNLSDEWCDFIEKYKYLATKDTLYIDCMIDDPSITDEDGCMYELCQTVIPDHLALKAHPEILLHDFEGGKYAVYHFK